MQLKMCFQILLFILITGLTFNSYSQQPTEVQRRKQQHAFYRSLLQVDSVKAEQVSRVQEGYKAGINALAVDTSLNEGTRRLKIKALMEVKNRQLQQLLTPVQQVKIIPTTELDQTAAPAKKN